VIYMQNLKLIILLLLEYPFNSVVLRYALPLSGENKKAELEKGSSISYYTLSLYIYIIHGYTSQ
jgi:hypothetical protein